MNPVEWLRRWAALDGAAPALLLGDRVIETRASLLGQMARLAGGLQGLGVGPGAPLAVVMPNRPDYLVALGAAWMLGAPVVPVNTKLHGREVAYILDHAEAVVVLVAEPEAIARHTSGCCRLVEVGGAEHRSLLAADPVAAIAPLDRDSLAWLFYTSGTTGRPKGVMISAGNLLAMTLAYLADVDQPGEEAAHLYAAPMSHGAGLYALVHLLRGGRHLLPESGGFEPAEILHLGRTVGRVSLFAAPTMVRRLVDAVVAGAGDGQGLDTIIYGGGPMYLADIEAAVAAIGPRFVQIYGQGECPMTITALSRRLIADRSHPRWRQRLVSVGQAQAPVTLRIADPEGRSLGTGDAGEILVRGAPVMLGYWRDPAATARTLRDGWLWTGDVGTIDEEGFLTLIDRSKDVIISGGSNIYPREVEEVLLQHPAVAEVAVVGHPDPEWGEVTVAILVPRPGHTVSVAELDALCLDHIARFKRPKHYRVVASLPKNHYGKVLKTDLRRLLTDPEPSTS